MSETETVFNLRGTEGMWEDGDPVTCPTKETDLE